MGRSGAALTVLRMRGWGEKSDVGVFWPVTSRPGIIKDSLSLSGSPSLFFALSVSLYRSLSLSLSLLPLLPLDCPRSLVLSLYYSRRQLPSNTVCPSPKEEQQREGERESERERELSETEKKFNKKLKKL